MEGAASLFVEADEAMKAALITGLNFAVKQNICKLISEEYPYNKKDRIEEFLSAINTNKELPLEIMLISSWRSILKSLADKQLTQKQGKELVEWIFKRESI